MSAAEQLASTTRRLYTLGWMRGTSGNVSVRDADSFLVTASGIDKSSAAAEHAVRVDLSGAALPGQVHSPSAEAKVHVAVLEATGAAAAVHVHSMSAVIAGARWPDGVPIEDVEQLKGIGRSAHSDRVTVPVVGNSQDMQLLSRWVLDAIDPAVPCVVVAEHGLYAWGSSLEEAVQRTESLDWLMEYALRLDALAALGNNVPTPQEDR